MLKKKMKKLILLSSVATMICWSTPSYAFFGVVYDALNYAANLQNKITNIKQLTKLTQQYQAILDDVRMAIEQAEQLGNMPQLERLYAFMDDVIYSDISKALMQGIYDIDPKSPNYMNEARTVLQNDFGIPKSDAKINKEWSNLYSASDAQRKINRSLGYEQETEAQVKIGQHLTGLKEKREHSTKIALTLDNKIRALPANSNTKRQELMARQITNVQAKQDIMIEYMQLSAIREQKKELEILRVKVAMRERAVKAAKKRHLFRTTASLDYSKRILK